MKALVVGGDGFIGGALAKALKSSGHEVVQTTRRDGYHDGFFLNLSFEHIPLLPDADVMYLVAGMPRFIDCEGSSLSWRVNVDAQVKLVGSTSAFPVFCSSDAVEWSGCAMSRQKAYVEQIVLMHRGAVVRPAKVAATKLPELCALFVKVGAERLSGVHRWT